MTIFLDKQRPPKKKMGRKQRKGSKSNPATGVQWANWLDDPSGAPGGGGGAPVAPVVTGVAPASIVTAVPTLITVTGTGFVSTSIIFVVGMGNQVTTFVSATSVTATITSTSLGAHGVQVKNPDDATFSNSDIGFTIVAAAADPTNSWLKADIIAWLKDHDVAIGDDADDRFTKAELLDIVETYLDGDRDTVEELLS